MYASSGDFPAHGLSSAELHNQSITQATLMIREAFPDTLVLPLLGIHQISRFLKRIANGAMIGNNDVFPDYRMPYGTSSWLEYLAQLWSPWLGGRYISILQKNVCID